MQTLPMPTPLARAPRRLWFPGPDRGAGPECPLWEDLRAAEAARRLLH